MTPVDRTRAPTPTAAPAVRLPEVRRFSLSGGLGVVVVPRRELPIVNLQLLVRGGSAALGRGEAGLAALTADMMDEGTPRRSALEVASAFEQLGTSLYSGAGFDASEMEVNVLSPRLPEALDLLAEVLLEPTFPEAEVERTKAERLARLVQELEDPRALATHAFARAVFGREHPWASPLLGTPRTLEALEREHVVRYYRERVHPGSAVLVAVGDVDAGDLASLLEPVLGRWRARERREPTLPDPPPVSETRVWVVHRSEAPQSEIRVGRVAVARDTEDYFPLVVMNTVLGGSFTARLNAKLREEKGYTYGAGSGFSMRRSPGPFVAHAAVHTPATAAAVAEFLGEMRTMCEEPVGSEELERAKRFVALRLPQRFETVADVTARVSEIELYDLPQDYFAHYVERIMSVSAEEVREVARRHIDPSRMVVVVAGDRDEVREPLESLRVGAVGVLPSLTWGEWSEESSPEKEVPKC